MQPTVEDYAFVTSYTPVPMANAVALLRSKLLRQVLSTIISIVISLVLWVVIDDKSTFLQVLLIGTAALSVVRLALLAIRLWRARRILSRLEGGPALRVDPLGLMLATTDGLQRWTWDEIEHIGAKPHEPLPGPELVVQRKVPPVDDQRARRGRCARRGRRLANQWRTPFMFLDVMPGSLDSAIRAHTTGRMSLDLRALDRLI